jgi:hypothetical protein
MSVLTLKKGNETLTIEQSQDSENPREWDNLSQMIFTGRYKHVGDKHNVEFNGDYESRQDFIEDGDLSIEQTIKDVVICKAVHLYSHSGECISTSYSGQFACRWDSGTIGFVIVTKQDIRKNWGIKRVTQKWIDKAEEIMDAEVETLNNYISGEVYSFNVEDDEGNNVDSCSGFYGTNFATNGILDYVDEKWHEEIKKH